MSSAFVPAPIPSETELTPNYYGESLADKARRKFKENPLVPLGCLVTSYTLIVAAIRMRQGRSLSMNYWLRARLVAQGATVVAIVGGTYYYGQSKGQKEEKARLAQERLLEQAAAQRAEFNARLAAAEEAHRLETEALSPTFKRTNSVTPLPSNPVEDKQSSQMDSPSPTSAQDGRSFWQKWTGLGRT
ncbi:hypothetical protein PUNSTDRAFT_49330 [Punctularia strigosozonata HHB-11173 SS5]|uniref:uncharacterized protein n=1 Tax=Punctularia strigosozonata (strain HHB-11173) TaxID=741275 RepID=UPI00044185AF|nr:uncharacterized protein PUNSTDRAFT_49330 [Punctularia strigosozonata HHB-11173 SS5]EIN14601.1 hypothetical protein PUNSTDRAFT_49330 [Punctularia strigosozonata HHB-11173 SS5]